MSTMQSGSNDQELNLTFERATNTGALCSFKCGQDLVDGIIKELDTYLPTNDLFLVKQGDEVVALFCISKNDYCLFLSDTTKEKMQDGVKPKPDSARDCGEEYWEQMLFNAVEISLLAVRADKRGRHIGSYIIEYVLHSLAGNPVEKREFLMVKALNIEEYTAVPFYAKCGFFPAQIEALGKSLAMYRIIPKHNGDDDSFSLRT